MTHVITAAERHCHPIIIDVQPCQPAPLPPNRRAIMTVGATQPRSRIAYEDLPTCPTRDALAEMGVTVPESRPLTSFAQWADACRAHMADVIGSPPIYETYATARGGLQLFGKQVWLSADGTGISGFLMDSLDGSLAYQHGVGTESSMFCANGIMACDHIERVPHTRFGVEHLGDMLRDTCLDAADKSAALQDLLNGWKATDVGHDLFFALLGVLSHRGYITSTIANAARRYWAQLNPPQDGATHHVTLGEDLLDQQSGFSLSSAYQAISGALHGVHPTKATRSMGGVKGVFEAVGAQGGAIRGIPKLDLSVRESRHTARA